MLHANSLQNLLDELQIDKGDLVFLHTSFKYLAHLQMTPQEILTTILDRLSRSGTLVMPSYAWNLDKTARPWKGYLQYFTERPTLDVRSTPSNLGIITELFRQHPTAKRSLSYFWPICASGALTELVTADQESIVHPYGTGSSFDLLRLNDCKVLGLGVSLNTSSLAPVADYCLGKDHQAEVFTNRPVPGNVVDYSGQVRATETFTLLPDIVRTIKPQVILDTISGAHIRRKDVHSSIHFSYKYQAIHDEIVKVGLESRAKRTPVPWLPEANSMPSETQLQKNNVCNR